jgi:hypothetical protein
MTSEAAGGLGGGDRGRRELRAVAGRLAAAGFENSSGGSGLSRRTNGAAGEEPGRPRLRGGLRGRMTPWSCGAGAARTRMRQRALRRLRHHRHEVRLHRASRSPVSTGTLGRCRPRECQNGCAKRSVPRGRPASPRRSGIAVRRGSVNRKADPPRGPRSGARLQVAWRAPRQEPGCLRGCGHQTAVDVPVVRVRLRWPELPDDPEQPDLDERTRHHGITGYDLVTEVGDAVPLHRDLAFLITFADEREGPVRVGILALPAGELEPLLLRPVLEQEAPRPVGQPAMNLPHGQARRNPLLVPDELDHPVTPFSATSPAAHTAPRLSPVMLGPRQRRGVARGEFLPPERILVGYSLGYERSADTAWAA